MTPQEYTPEMLTREQVEELVRAFVLKVFGWMAGGLLLTAVVSMMTVNSETLLSLILSNQWVFIGLIIAQLGLVVLLSARIQALSAMTATMIFCGYSALTGVTLSVVFLVYTSASIATTFLVTAGTFGVTAAYGYVTKRDLTALGGFMTMGLIGLVLASLVNLFFQNEIVYWLITYVGVFIFVGLTAYDMQKIKGMSGAAIESGEAEQKAAIIGALRLYLDFINLFLLLLRILGRKR